ncbi:hypothetical protein DACRYDRAFT_55085 [Dacryopinax primogenitus]|uniref:S1 motif domain-containing protein n=1 Tax=Dacryopinax primogenitus (strain DJM 731) TaxID=1858805 RepID=M5FRK7_DACPD|nr:uncharacterized protein DACRYDRAFT_55085 [Dacryopinax primogenitus]EJT99795.1 hypothetical protein DACRYDRAFT_55085 [Dacryopinax primogenitus]
MSDIVLPGQALSLPQRAPLPQTGTGIYNRTCLRSTIIGIPSTTGSLISVIPPRPIPPVPQPGSLVLGKITHLSPTSATLLILAVDNNPSEEFTGIIRTQDIRATERDKLRMGDCFRGGDVVRALVLSLGDQRNYYLSTARNDLGVVFATSEAGGIMQPINWQEMRCPRTGQIEKRKCAKP